MSRENAPERLLRWRTELFQAESYLRYGEVWKSEYVAAEASLAQALAVFADIYCRF